MRLKHVKGAEDAILKSPYVIQNPKQYRGNYAALFGNCHPIYLEIGMGKGDFLIENAKRYPMINFIGIEKYDSVLVRATEKLEQEILENLKLIRMDATEIEDVFDHEINKIYLNFSDPWPKARQAKRRLSSPVFLTRYESLFKEVSNIEMKTDNRKLFEYSLISFVSFGYQIKEVSCDLYQDDTTCNIATEYETKFVARGNPIYKVHVFKQK